MRNIAVSTRKDRTLSGSLERREIVSPLLSSAAETASDFWFPAAVLDPVADTRYLTLLITKSYQWVAASDLRLGFWSWAVPQPPGDACKSHLEVSQLLGVRERR